MTSAYIEWQKKEAAIVSERPNRIKAALEAIEQLSDDELPPVRMMNIIGSHDRTHFIDSMRALFPEFIQRAKLDPAANILDIGCGSGRLALPFSFYLEDGKYYGIDVWEDGVRWCQEHITARRPNFRFETLASENNYYIDAYDPSKNNNYSLPFIIDNSLDFAFAISVFTHLMEQDSRQYLKELGRTLKPSGIAYLTAFIIDGHFFKYREQTKQHQAVKPVANGVWQAYEGQDFFGGYTYAKWRTMVEEAGLQIVSYEVGSWAQKPGARTYQDTFILVRQ